MSVQPTVLTSEVLTLRETAPMVMIQSEEILTVRTPAYSKSNSDVSFLVRQPSGSCILSNYVEVEMDVIFTLQNGAIVKGKYNGSEGGNGVAYMPNATPHQTDFGLWPEMLPFQNKCVRNATITINGSSISSRTNEFGKEYCLLHCDRDYMNKIGGGINDYTDLTSYKRNQGGAGDDSEKYDILNKQSQRQADKYNIAHLSSKSGNSYVSNGYDNDTQSPLIKFREPLYIGPFGAFLKADSFPYWSCESSKSPGLLHIHSLQLQFALEDNWKRQLYLMIQSYKSDNSADGVLGAHNQITNVEIRNAHLITKWHLPPPRLTSAALTQTVSVATFDVLRFVCDSDNQSALLHHGNAAVWTLNAVSFPYMPSLFTFSICPHYAHGTASCGARVMSRNMLQAMKMDKRATITSVDLTVNTSNAALPYLGNSDTHSFRLNAKRLYELTMENVSNYSSFPYNFEEWYQHCGFVAISPSQLSGQLNSPNIRGSVVVQGKVNSINLTGHPINIKNLSSTVAGNRTSLTLGQVHNAGIGGRDYIYPPDMEIPRYRCLISGYYTNRSLILDAKSGVLNENTFSESFNQSLRLG